MLARESGSQKAGGRTSAPDRAGQPAMESTPASDVNPSDTTAGEGRVVGPERGDVPTDHLDLPTDAQLLGVDAEGHTHLHSPREDWVVVITPDGDVTHEQEIGSRSIWDWVAHTERCRGEWASLRYQRGGWAENLVRTLLEGDAADEATAEAPR